MKLSELKNILQFDTDFADTEIDASFYTELEDILPQYANELVVQSISTNYIVCNFYPSLCISWGWQISGIARMQ